MKSLQTTTLIHIHLLFCRFSASLMRHHMTDISWLRANTLTTSCPHNSRNLRKAWLQQNTMTRQQHIWNQPTEVLRTIKSEKSDISVQVSKSHLDQQQQFSVFLTSLTLRLLPWCQSTLRGYEAVESSCSASCEHKIIKIKHWSIFMCELQREKKE